MSFILVQFRSCLHLFNYLTFFFTKKSLIFPSLPISLQLPHRSTYSEIIKVKTRRNYFSQKPGQFLKEQESCILQFSAPQAIPRQPVKFQSARSDPLAIHADLDQEETLAVVIGDRLNIKDIHREGIRVGSGWRTGGARVCGPARAHGRCCSESKCQAAL